MENIPQLIIQGRAKKNNMSQTELAKLLGIPQPRLSEYENGVIMPRKAMLHRIFNILGIKIIFVSDDKLQRLADIVSDLQS